MYKNTFDYGPCMGCCANCMYPFENTNDFKLREIEADERKEDEKEFSKDEAASIALLLGIDFSRRGFDLNQFWMGVNVELEHERRDEETNVTSDDPIITGKIALAHLNEFPDYYTRLKVLEDDAEKYWSSKK